MKAISKNPKVQRLRKRIKAFCQWFMVVSIGKAASFVVSFAAIGALLLLVTHAASNSGVIVAAAGGQLCGDAAVISDSSAGGSVVEFGASGNNPSCSGSSSGGGTGGSTGSSGAGAPPTTRLGIWIAAEDTSSSFVTISGQKPDVANYYQAWDQSWPTQFMQTAVAAGATPFVELEPWNMGPNWNQTPSFSDITSGKYDSWLTTIGQDAKALNTPVIFTFAHEFNVSGQYPWAQGDTGSCGSSSCTPAQWIQAWDHVESVINKAAGSNTYWMWVPNADTGGSTTDPTPWWPGASEVQMVGVDGYPDTTYGSQFGTFSGEFGPVFGEIHKLTNLPIFIAETDLEPLGSGNYESIPNFIKDLFAAGGDGVLEWEDGSPKMSSAQWSQLDAALAQYPS